MPGLFLFFRGLVEQPTSYSSLRVGQRIRWSTHHCCGCGENLNGAAPLTFLHLRWILLKNHFMRWIRSRSGGKSNVAVRRFGNSLSPGLATCWKKHSGFRNQIGEIPRNLMSISNKTDPQKKKQNPRLHQSLPSYYSIKFGSNFIKGGVIVVNPSI